MKLVKHVDSEFYAGMSDVAGESCQGILTGLVLPDEKRLEGRSGSGINSRHKELKYLQYSSRFSCRFMIKK
jgi:hypothetical protein